MAVVAVRAQPGARSDRVGWDPWRRRWTVACRAVARSGEANEALLSLLAARLGVPRGQVRWKGGFTNRDKLLEVDGLSSEEIERRLRSAAVADSRRDDGGRPSPR